MIWRTFKITRARRVIPICDFAPIRTSGAFCCSAVFWGDAIMNRRSLIMCFVRVLLRDGFSLAEIVVCDSLQAALV